MLGEVKLIARDPQLETCSVKFFNLKLEPCYIY